MSQYMCADVGFMCAEWLRRNIFDFVVVMLSIFALWDLPLPNELTVLRSLKVFRAARLFRCVTRRVATPVGRT